MAFSAQAAVPFCGSSCTITVTVTIPAGGCPNNLCTMTVDKPDVWMKSASIVTWQLSGTTAGSFTVFFVPDPDNVIYDASVNPIFTGTSGSSAGGKAVVGAADSSIRVAKYFISWTDGTNRAFLDPRVVVSGNAMINQTLKPEAPVK